MIIQSKHNLGFGTVGVVAFLGVTSLFAAFLSPLSSTVAASSETNGNLTVSSGGAVFAQPETLPVEAILVNITNTATGEKFSMTVDPTATSATFTGLDPQADYTVEVAKKSQAGKSTAAVAVLKYEKTGEVKHHNKTREVKRNVPTVVTDYSNPIAWVTTETNVYSVTKFEGDLRDRNRQRRSLDADDFRFSLSGVPIEFRNGKSVPPEVNNVFIQIAWDLISGISAKEIENKYRVEDDDSIRLRRYSLSGGGTRILLDIEEDFRVGSTWYSELDIEIQYFPETFSEIDYSRPTAWGTKIENQERTEIEEYTEIEEVKKSKTKEKKLKVDDEDLIIQSSNPNPTRSGNWTSGTVIAVGEDVENFSVGDAVSYRQGKVLTFNGQKYIVVEEEHYLVRK